MSAAHNEATAKLDTAEAPSNCIGMDSELPFWKVDSFTDSSGRTSCAKDEREHYRFRCLALSDVASTLRKEFQSKRARVAELESFIARKADPVYNPDNAAHVALYQKCLLVHRPITQAAEARLARVEVELDFVMKHNTEARELCDLISERLPTEPVDIVYAYVESYPQVLEVDYVQQ